MADKTSAVGCRIDSAERAKIGDGIPHHVRRLDQRIEESERLTDGIRIAPHRLRVAETRGALIKVLSDANSIIVKTSFAPAPCFPRRAQFPSPGWCCKN